MKVQLRALASEIRNLDSTYVHKPAGASCPTDTMRLCQPHCPFRQDVSLIPAMILQTAPVALYLTFGIEITGSSVCDLMRPKRSDL